MTASEHSVSFMIAKLCFVHLLIPTSKHKTWHKAGAQKEFVYEMILEGRRFRLPQALRRATLPSAFSKKTLHTGNNFLAGS